MTFYSWLTAGFVAACAVLLIVAAIAFIRGRGK